MRRSPTTSARSGDDGILPMVNVVFLLLMFFMVAGEITSDRETPPLPVSSSEQRASRDIIRVDIPTAGVILIDGKPLSGSLDDALREIETSPSGRASEADGSASSGQAETAPGARRDRVIAVHVARQLDVGELDPLLAQMRGSRLSRLQIVTHDQP